MRLSSDKVSRLFTFKTLYTVPGNTLWSLSKTLFIFCRHKFSNFARPSYGSLVYSRGFANYFETKLSFGGGICDHTLDVASEHLHVTYFIAAIKINSRSFRMWHSIEFLQLYDTTFDLNNISKSLSFSKKKPNLHTRVLPFYLNKIKSSIFLFICPKFHPNTDCSPLQFAN